MPASATRTAKRNARWLLEGFFEVRLICGNAEGREAKKIFLRKIKV